MTTTIRKLAALMFTDIVGYSKLAKQDEQLAMELVKEHREVIRKNLERHAGNERQTIGDGFFIEFSSAVDAVRCAINIQSDFRDRQRHLPIGRQIQIRIGIHMGDIVASGQDLYGNNVNIAARIEPLADPGGVCLSGQIHDHVQDVLTEVDFVKLGRKKLKNIRGNTSVYKVLMPGENQLTRAKKLMGYFKTFEPLSTNQTIVSTFVCGLMGLLAFICLSMGTEGPAMDFSSDSNKSYLPTNWQYTVLDCTKRLPVCLQNIQEANWKPYDHKKSWQYTKQIKGRYLLRLQFSTAIVADHPALVLGLVSESHRVFLNRTFIGGSDTHYNLASYSFDNSLINKNTQNEIIIEAKTRSRMNPGISPILGIGSYIGNFSTVEKDIISNRMQFQIFKSIYFAISMLMMFACIVLSMFLGKHSPVSYCSIFLLLGCINIAYYLPWTGAAFDYQFMRFLKTLSLSMLPFILISGKLRTLNLADLELKNNIAGLGYATILGVLFFGYSFSGNELVTIYNSSILTATIYGVLTLVFLSIHQKNAKTSAKNQEWTHFNYLFTLFAIISFGPLIGSLKGPIAKQFIPSGFRWLMIDFSLISPFAFSLLVVAIIVNDSISKGRSVSKNKSFDQLRLRLLHLLHSGDQLENTTLIAQKEICSAIKAKRSTLYVFENLAGTGPMRAEHIVAEEPARYQISTSIPSHSGIIGYCLNTKTPLLISDLKNDIRFGGTFTDSKDDKNSYESGSCMIFPLMAAGSAVGVMTIADKQFGIFDQEDFSRALEVSSIIALLVENKILRSENDKIRLAA